MGLSFAQIALWAHGAMGYLDAPKMGTFDALQELNAQLEIQRQQLLNMFSIACGVGVVLFLIVQWRIRILRLCSAWCSASALFWPFCGKSISTFLALKQDMIVKFLLYLGIAIGIFCSYMSFRESSKTNTTLNDLITSYDEHFASIDKHFASIDKHFASNDEHFASIDKQFADIRALIGNLSHDVHQALTPNHDD